jgi:hypothetical protein
MNRNALYGTLIAVAFSTAVSTAVMIPTVSALAQSVVQPAASPADCVASCGPAISATLQSLVHDFVMASIRRDGLEASPDTEALGLAIQERHKALSALAFHPPVSLLELAVKLNVITEYAEDTERWAARAVAQDAVRLAGEIK